MSEQTRRLHHFELEPEVRDWLDGLSDSDFKRVDEVCGLLAAISPLSAVSCVQICAGAGMVYMAAGGRAQAGHGRCEQTVRSAVNVGP